MRAALVTKRLSFPLLFALTSSSSSSSLRHLSTLIPRAVNPSSQSQTFIRSTADHASRGLLAAPWSATQLGGAKFRGSDLISLSLSEAEHLLKFHAIFGKFEFIIFVFNLVQVKPGNVIEKKGKLYKVVKAQHTTQGRGGARIQVELRDVDSGNKVIDSLRTDETVEKVFVEERSLTYLYTDEETACVVLSDPKTFDQTDVPKHLFGDSLPYLQDDMTVTVELYEDRAMSAAVPTRVTCTVAEAQVPMKGMGATPHTKKVLLDNGLTVKVPPHIVAGDQILINTIDHSYISRA